MSRRYNWPPLAALNALRILAGYLGRTPTLREIDAQTPSSTVYVRLFGSVSAACRLAGLTPNPRGGQSRTLCKRGHARPPKGKCPKCISLRNKWRRRHDPEWRDRIQSKIRQWQQSPFGKARKSVYCRKYYAAKKLAILHRTARAA